MDYYLLDYLGKIDAILFDLGISSMQLDEAERGFAYSLDGPLDMRFSKKSGKTAKDLVMKLSFEELRKIIQDYGEERWAKRIAEAICKARVEKEIRTTKDLENIIYKAVGYKYTDKKHPATRTFQALRIATNDEFGHIKLGIEKAINMLKKGGRLAIISFHSLEDKIVKNKLKDFLGNCNCPKNLALCICQAKAEIKIINKKPVYPSEEEILVNRRSRSAILRIVEKL